VADIDISASESFVLPNPLFANKYDLYLTPLGKADNHYNEWNLMHYLSTTAQTTYGITSPYYWDVKAGVNPIVYFGTTDGILQFDTRIFTTTKQLKYNETIKQYAVSANNKYLITKVNYPQKIYLEDLTDPAKSKSIDISAVLSQVGDNISISNNGTGILMNNLTAILYDYINERKLAEMNLPATFIYFYLSKISASGNFFYLQTNSSSEFYQYMNNQPVLLQSGSNQGDDLVLSAGYLPGNNEKLVRAYHNRIEVLDCNTWTIEKKWQFPNLISNAYNLDLKSGKLLISENSKLVLFDVMNGTREELTTTDNQAWAIASFFYNNGYLFWGEGKAIKKN
jgi:hypothetical protein